MQFAPYFKSTVQYALSTKVFQEWYLGLSSFTESSGLRLDLTADKIAYVDNTLI